MIVLSTKKLSDAQKAPLLAQGVTIIEHDFIRTLPVKIKELNPPYSALVFTSKNAVNSFLQHPEAEKLKNVPVLCVGQKTAELLTEAGFTVEHSEPYAAMLVDYMKSDLARFQQMEKIAFFVGTSKLPTLPNFFAENAINVEEILAYQSVPAPRIIDEQPDIILFFSPSAIVSYCICNLVRTEKVFCIGTTTADTAQHFWQDLTIADVPTIDSVIEGVVRSLKA
jgi:uroporphyrinogen-III synthase